MLELVVPQEPGVRQAQDAFRDLFYARLLPILERVLDDMVPPDRLIRLERLELNLGSTGWDLDPEPLEVQMELRLRRQMEQILNSAQVEEAQPLGEYDTGDADWNLLLHYLVHGEVPEWLSPADFKPDAEWMRMLRSGDAKQSALLRKVMALPVVLLRVAWIMPEAARTLALDRLLPGQAPKVLQIHADLGKLHQRQPLLPMEATMFAYRLWESSLSMVTLLPETAVSVADILPIYLQSLLPQPIFRPRDRVWLLMRSMAAVPTGELSGEMVQAVAEMASLAGIDAGLPMVSVQALEQADAEKVNAKKSTEAESKTSESLADTALENEPPQVDSPPSSIEAPPTVQETKPSEIEASTPATEEATPSMDEGALDRQGEPVALDAEISQESPASLSNAAAELAGENDRKPLSEPQLLEDPPESRHLAEREEAKESTVPPSIPEGPTTEPVESVEAMKEVGVPESRTVPEMPEQEAEDPAPKEFAPEFKEESSVLEGSEQPLEEILAIEGNEQSKEQPPTSEGASVDSKELETQHLPESDTKPLKEAPESAESVIIDGPAAEFVHSQQKPPVPDSEEADIQVSKPEESSSASPQPLREITEASLEPSLKQGATPEEAHPESVSIPETGEQPQDAPETLLRSPEEDSIADRFRRFREQWAQNPESLIPRTQSEPLHIPWRQNDPKHGMGVLYAGLVIAWPYIGPLFKRLEWLEKREFVSPEAQFAAVHLLRYVATGAIGEVQDHELGFCKVMAGLHPTDPVPTEIPLTEAQCAAADEMVDAVIANWGAVKRTSRAGLRQTFLQRAGNIRSDENGWIVHLERETMDILLDRIPWGYSTIRLGWQPKMIFVQW